MLNSARDYEQVDVSNVDVTGAILPTRYAAGPMGTTNRGAIVMRAEDIAFLFEAYLERNVALLGPSSADSDKEGRAKIDLRPTLEQWGFLLDSNTIRNTVFSWIDPALRLGDIAWPNGLRGADDARMWLVREHGMVSCAPEPDGASHYNQILRFRPLLYYFYDVKRSVRCLDTQVSTLDLAVVGSTTTRYLVSGQWQESTAPYDHNPLRGLNVGWIYNAVASSAEGLHSEIFTELAITHAPRQELSSKLADLTVFIIAWHDATGGGDWRSRVYRRTIDLTNPTLSLDRSFSASVARDFGFSESADNSILVYFETLYLFDLDFPAEINSLDWLWTPQKEEQGEYDDA